MTDSLPKIEPKKATRSFRTALLLIVLAETLSFFGFVFPAFSSVATVITCLTVLVLAFVRYDLAILAFLAELFIGSQGGYLFSLGSEGGLGLSLRMGMFLAIFCAWAVQSSRALLRGEGLDWLSAMRKTGMLWPYLALLAVFSVAAVRGLSANGFADMFFDANGYAFFAILPAVVSGFLRLDPSRFVGVALAAVSSSVLKAVFVFYVFSHRIQAIASPLYVWVRDTRVGEIAIHVGDFHRVFFQSHLFGMFLALIGTVLAAYAASVRSRRFRCALAAVSLAAVALVLGLSRSFWFGLFFGALSVMAVLVWAKAETAVWKRMAVSGILAATVAVAAIMGIYAIPFPKRGTWISFSGMLGGRATSLVDDAAVSRWSLLPILNRAALRHPFLGSGFGTRVEYRTSDPRLLADYPNGMYSTYAFEWGYSDLWLKLGLVGLIAYGWLVHALIRPVLAIVRRSRLSYGTVQNAAVDPQAVVALGVLAATVALLATNVFSPYLNHPLGIGTLAMLAGWNGRMQKS